MENNFLGVTKAIRAWIGGYINDCHYELYKIKSVRSSYTAIFFSVVGIILLSVVVCSIYDARSSHLSLYQLAAADPVFLSLSGTFLAQLGVVVFSVLSVTSEYGYGTIVTSALLEPRRMRFAFVKITIIVSVVFVSSLVSLTLAFMLGEHVLAAKFEVVSIASFIAVRAIVGTALYLSALSAICAGLGLILRHTAGTIASVLAILLVLPAVISLLPAPWSTDIVRYLPSSAGVVLAHSLPLSNMMTPWISLLLLLLYSLIPIVAGLYFICRRDI